MNQKQILGISLLTVVLGPLAVLQAKAQGSTVKLDVVVRDSANAPVTGLKKEDLVVSDNGAAQALTSFTEVTDDTTTVVLVFDLINCPQTLAAIERDQLTKILHANGGVLKYPTVLTVVSATGVSNTPSPSTDGNALAKVLGQVNIGPDINQRASGGAAALQRINSSVKALNDVLGSASRIPGRKLVFWMSPGWALMGGSALSPQQEQDIFNEVKQYSNGLRQARETLYMLNMQGASASVGNLQQYRQYLKGVGDPSKADFADTSLQVLATQSGGLVLNSNDLATMFDRCLSDAGPHYEIEFPAGEPTKKSAFHEIQVTVNHPGATARTRNGYYPQ